jgi:uncharacterized protein YcbK (DUF882 family)
LFRRAVLAIALLLIPGVAHAADATKATAGKAPQAKVASKRPKKPSRYAPVELYQINTKETLMLRFQDDRGRPVKGWQKRFDRFMRCHVTGATHRMEPRLAHLMYQTARHYDGHRLEVVSGYRHPKVARNPRSPHKQGLACDFRLSGIANTVLRDYLRKAYEHVGVGYYPNSVFVHLDVRKNNGPSAFWIDYSGPGQPAFYSGDPNEDLRTGRVYRIHPGTGEGEGQAEGQDDMDQAGLAGSPAKAQGKSAARVAESKPANGLSVGSPVKRPPLEVKDPPDPFGD